MPYLTPGRLAAILAATGLTRDEAAALKAAVDKFAALVAAAPGGLVSDDPADHPALAAQLGVDLDTFYRIESLAVALRRVAKL
jgi:hypothetical protein